MSYDIEVKFTQPPQDFDTFLVEQGFVDRRKRVEDGPESCVVSVKGYDEDLSSYLIEARHGEDPYGEASAIRTAVNVVALLRRRGTNDLDAKLISFVEGLSEGQLARARREHVSNRAAKELGQLIADHYTSDVEVYDLMADEKIR